MAVQKNKLNRAYGIDNALQELNPANVKALRAPGNNDNYEVGTLWIDQSTDAAYLLTSYTAGVPVWTTSPASGVGTFTAVTVTPGDLTVAIGNADITAGTLNVGGNATFGGDLAIAGALTAADLDISTVDAVTITSTDNVAQAIYFHADTGGALSTLELENTPGTSADAIKLTATAGGVHVIAAGAALALEAQNQAINLTSGTGAINIGADLVAHTVSVGNVIGATAVAINSGTGHITLTTASTGDIILNSDDTMLLDADGVLELNSSAGVISIGNDADANGINIGTGASARPITIGNVTTSTGITLNSGTGGVAINTTTTGDFVVTSADTVLIDSAGVLELNSSAGVIGIGNDAVAQNINVGTGAAARLITVGNVTTTTGVVVNAGTTGIDMNSSGAFSLDGVLASNITTTGAGIDLTLSSVLGSVLIESTEDAANNILLHSNGGVSDTIRLHADLGTGVGSINLLSDVGGITLTATGLASADAINLEATAGGVDIDGALQVNIASSQAAVANSVRIVASAADGGIDIDAGTGGITLDSTGAISIDGAAASNVTVTGAGLDLTLSSVGGSVAIASNEAVASAINLTASDAAGGIALSAGTNGVAIDAIGGSFVVTAGTGSNGSVNLSSTGTGDIILNSDDTVLIDADGVLELNSSAGAINIGNDADAQAINIGNAGVRPIQVGNASAGTTLLLLGPANVGITLQNSIRIMTGAGSPNGAVTAPIGSMWLRTDAGGATERIYVNTDAGTTWTNVTCAA